MNPQEQYDPNAQQLRPASNRNLLIVACVVVALLLLLGLRAMLAHHAAAPTTGSVIIRYNLTDHSDVTAYFNGQHETPQGATTTYKMKPSSSYTVTLKRTGFKDFTTPKFALETGETVVINATMQATTSNLTDLTSLSQIDALSNDIKSGTITNADYLYDHTWVMLTTNTADDSSLIVIAYYNTSTGKWTSAITPETVYDPTAITSLPSQVQDYLSNNGEVFSDD